MKKIASILACCLLLVACTPATGGTAAASKSASGTATASQSAQASGSAAATAVKEESRDVVIIGAGGAGMAAAVAADEKGASVIVLEKMAIAGGNTTRATAGMNASETKFQKAQGIKDSNDLFLKETLKGGYDKADSKLVKYMVDHSAETIDWLDKMGMSLSNVTFSGGFSVERIHRPADGSAVGDYLVTGFIKQLKERNVPIVFNTTATEIILENGKAVAVMAKDKDGKVTRYNAKSVVVATGGFAANMEMIVGLKSNLKGFVTTNQAGATGDGIKLAEKAGGATVDMAEIQIHPTVEQTTSDMVTEALRGEGAILVNSSGERFTNELLTRDKVSAAEIAQKGSFAYILFDQRVRDKNKSVEKYVTKGYVLQGETIEELAKAMSVDAAKLAETIKTYNGYVDAGKDAAFGRETGLHKVEKGPYYAVKIAPGVHHTMGGIKINTETQVISAKNEAIPALYAAGEVTGGIHGGNRIGGNAVCDIMVFGRTAGTQAADYAAKNGGTGKDKTAATEKAAAELKPNEGVKAMYKDGEYTGKAKGNNAEFDVVVTVKDGFITSIKFPNHKETGAMFQSVVDNIVPQVIQKQSSEVDVMSGATNSSKGIMDALTKILAEAKK